MKQRVIERVKPQHNGRSVPLAHAGTQLVLELWGAQHLDDAESIKRILVDAVQASGATLLNIHLHQFSPAGGITGVAVVSESHITIHTWPEFDYAAIDIFLCGRADPYKALDVLKEGFQPKHLQVVDLKRGVTV